VTWVGATSSKPAPDHVSEPPAPGSAGVIVRIDARTAEAAGVPETAWLPATIVRRVALASSTTTLGTSSGISLGLALVEGRLLTLVGFGVTGPRAPVVLCTQGEGDMLALAVETIVASGRFDDVGDEGAVRFIDKIVWPLDLASVMARLEAAFWIEDATPPRLSLLPRSRQINP